MKLSRHPLFAIGLPWLAISALLSACSPREAPEAHAGHDHAEHARPTPADPDHARHEGQGGAAQCAEHQLPESECGICNPQRLAALKPGEGLKIRMPSADSAGLAGVEVAAPVVGAMTDGVECLAELGFNQNRFAQIAAPVGGTLHSVDIDLGGRVEENQAVARIWSAAIAEAVARAVLTHQTLERERRLRLDRITSEKDLQQAEAEHRAACQQARTLGFSEAQIDHLGTTPTEPVMLEVRAPFAGEIVERNAVRGALVEPGKPLFTVTDRSTMWAMLNLPEHDLGRIEVGQEVELQVDSLPQRRFAGRLTWIGAEVDERTRLARARVEVANPNGVLKARMFARARVVTRTTPQALLLPTAALHLVQGKALVFVKLADDLFEARAVSIGGRREDVFEVVAGLAPADVVAVGRGFAVKSQLLSSRLGAGCADE